MKKFLLVLILCSVSSFCWGIDLAQVDEFGVVDGSAYPKIPQGVQVEVCLGKKTFKCTMACVKQGLEYGVLLKSTKQFDMSDPLAFFIKYNGDKPYFKVVSNPDAYEVLSSCLPMPLSSSLQGQHFELWNFDKDAANPTIKIVDSDMIFAAAWAARAQRNYDLLTVFTKNSMIQSGFDEKQIKIMVSGPEVEFTDPTKSVLPGYMTAETAGNTFVLCVPSTASVYTIDKVSGALAKLSTQGGVNPLLWEEPSVSSFGHSSTRGMSLPSLDGKPDSYLKWEGNPQLNLLYSATGVINAGAGKKTSHLPLYGALASGTTALGTFIWSRKKAAALKKVEAEIATLDLNKQVVPEELYDKASSLRRWRNGLGVGSGVSWLLTVLLLIQFFKGRRVN